MKAMHTIWEIHKTNTKKLIPSFMVIIFKYFFIHLGVYSNLKLVFSFFPPPTYHYSLSISHDSENAFYLFVVSAYCSSGQIEWGQHFSSCLMSTYISVAFLKSTWQYVIKRLKNIHTICLCINSIYEESILISNIILI